MAHPVHRASANGQSRNGTPTRRKVVLVVEDYASIGGLIAALLRQEGYRAVRAWDGQEAIRLARGRHPDLILLDLNAPPRDATENEVLRQLRQHEATRRVPKLVVAANGLNLSEEERTSVNDLVAKPFHIDVMLNAVRKALGEPLVDVQVRSFEGQDYFLNGY